MKLFSRPKKKFCLHFNVDLVLIILHIMHLHTLCLEVIFVYVMFIHAKVTNRSTYF